MRPLGAVGPFMMVLLYIRGSDICNYIIACNPQNFILYSMGTLRFSFLRCAKAAIQGRSPAKEALRGDHARNRLSAAAICIRFPGRRRLFRSLGTTVKKSGPSQKESPEPLTRYAGRDSLRSRVGVVKPTPSQCPPVIGILLFESQR